MTMPAPGQTYTSPVTRDLSILIHSVSNPEPDGFYLVEFCHPDDRDDMSAPLHEVTNDEWAELYETHRLTLAA